MQFREFLHDSHLAGRPLEKSAGARMASATLSHRTSATLNHLASFGRTKAGRRQA